MSKEVLNTEGQTIREDYISRLAADIEKENEELQHDHSLLDDIKNLSKEDKEKIRKELGLDDVTVSEDPKPEDPKPEDPKPEEEE